MTVIARAFYVYFVRKGYARTHELRNEYGFISQTDIPHGHPAARRRR